MKSLHMSQASIHFTPNISREGQPEKGTLCIQQGSKAITFTVNVIDLDALEDFTAFCYNQLGGPDHE